jgi:hypothetical protein
MLFAVLLSLLGTVGTVHCSRPLALPYKYTLLNWGGGSTAALSPSDMSLRSFMRASSSTEGGHGGDQPTSHYEAFVMTYYLHS